MICVSPLLRLNAHVQVEQPHIHQVTWSVLSISSRRCNVRKAAIYLAQNRIKCSMVTAVSSADRRIYEKNGTIVLLFLESSHLSVRAFERTRKVGKQIYLGGHRYSCIIKTSWAKISVVVYPPSEPDAEQY